MKFNSSEIKEIRQEVEVVGILLRDDFQMTRDNLFSSNTPPTEIQFWRRMLIRNFFAAVEGWTFQCKRTALAVTNFTEVEFERGELALLEEESYDLTDKGAVNVGKSKLNTLYNFIFALKMVVKACDEGDLEIDKSGVGWQSLQDTLRIRDRITHPKYPLDMEITDVEMKAFDKAADWYGHLLIALGELLEKFEQRHLSGFVRIN